jgi:hypothetical protein
MCGSTCVGRIHAHHQEHTTTLAASGLPVECGGSSVGGRGLAGKRLIYLSPLPFCKLTFIYILHKTSVRTSQKTWHVFLMRTNPLILFREVFMYVHYLPYVPEF